MISLLSVHQLRPVVIKRSVQFSVLPVGGSRVPMRFILHSIAILLIHRADTDYHISVILLSIEEHFAPW